LELRLQENRWQLYIDSVSVTDLSGRASQLPAPRGLRGGAVSAQGPGGHRLPVSTEEMLPQGVSLNAETGRYEANIRIGGRFKSLGDFSSPDEAHERYSQAKRELGQ